MSRRQDRSKKQRTLSQQQSRRVVWSLRTCHRLSLSCRCFTWQGDILCPWPRSTVIFLSKVSTQRCTGDHLRDTVVSIKNPNGINSQLREVKSVKGKLSFVSSFAGMSITLHRHGRGVRLGIIGDAMIGPQHYIITKAFPRSVQELAVTVGVPRTPNRSRSPSPVGPTGSPNPTTSPGYWGKNNFNSWNGLDY